MDNKLKKETKKQLKGKHNINFEERVCSKIKKKGEIFVSQPEK